MALNNAVLEGGVVTRDGLVRVNHAELMHKLRLRGKAPAALKEARISYETLAKIRRGEPIAARTFEKIVVQLAKWPVLVDALDLIERIP